MTTLTDLLPEEALSLVHQRLHVVAPRCFPLPSPGMPPPADPLFEKSSFHYALDALLESLLQLEIMKPEDKGPAFARWVILKVKLLAALEFFVADDLGEAATCR